MRRRVVITGQGAVSGAGVGARKLWDAAREGRSLVRELVFPRPYKGRVKIGVQVPDFDPLAHLDKTTLAYCDPFTQYALVAADEAVAEAGFSRETIGGPRCAVILGTGIGGVRTIVEGLWDLYVQGKRPEVLSVPKLIASAGPSMLSIRFKAQGPVFAVSSACSSASQAIGMGMQLVRAGVVDRAIVGGAEGSLSNATQTTWEMLRVLTPDKCRPFSQGRNGMSIGDGAAIFVLESAEAAAARGVEPICEVIGYGTSSDAYDPIRPDRDGAVRAMSMALEDADVAPETIDYINAHGTATALNDPTEAEAIGQVFGDRAPMIPVSSTKPIHGHGLGAAGALELVCAIGALRDQIAPPTINFLDADPKCPVDCVPNVARPVAMTTVMSNSFAFGGINAVLIVRSL